MRQAPVQYPPVIGQGHRRNPRGVPIGHGGGAPKIRPPFLFEVNLCGYFLHSEGGGGGGVKAAPDVQVTRTAGTDEAPAGRRRRSRRRRAAPRLSLAVRTPFGSQNPPRSPLDRGDRRSPAGTFSLPGPPGNHSRRLCSPFCPPRREMMKGKERLSTFALFSFSPYLIFFSRAVSN